ncbi:maleylacetoacetate isomerase [Pseudocolwellia agarivorans]|uniref:maleylacetoacetate isomerase n=1 Tax=Pseudocolwellia agarivorans TaxID=1911682 RepID=UPI000985E6BB|nr:maleylacetoacetate isomerase [Pseudocolwellia agarivorans]
MKLYSYHRSSAAYRVRIALNLKDAAHTLVPVNLLTGEHTQAPYTDKQPQGLVPCLETDDGRFLSQSGAIIQYIEALYPQHPLVPTDAFAAAEVRSMIDLIACDIHPLDNLRVLKYLTQTLNVNEDEKMQWYFHWINKGFNALEGQLKAAPYSLGDTVSLVDLYLIPQVYNALRFKLDMTPYPNILAIYNNCNKLPAFDAAKPENQIDFPKAD